MRRLIVPFSVLLSLYAAHPARAQQTPVVSSPDPGIRVFVMTMGPGSAVWERFGHNALWIHTENPKSDVAYNWGLFDFAQPGFVPRLMAGQMMYWMAGFDADRTAQAFAAANRSVWIQELNLTPEQKVALRDYVQWNSLEENKYYRYDYYRDNCSTRVRDVIDRVLGGQIRAATETRQTATTYRSHTRILTENDIPVYTGLELAMGPNIDRPISEYEEMFLPLLLRENIRDLRVRRPDGSDVPLVLSEATLYADTDREPLPETPPSRNFWYLLAGVVTGVILVALSLASAHGSKPARAAYIILALLWSFAAGFFGLLIALLWALTDHYPTYRNENVLQVNVLSLVLLVLIPLAVYRGRAGQHAVRIAFLIVLISLLGFVLQVLPWLDQVNGEIIGLALPIHLGLAWSLAVLGNYPTGGERVARAANG
jgi:hypothetical protein